MVRLVDATLEAPAARAGTSREPSRESLASIVVFTDR